MNGAPALDRLQEAFAAAVAGSGGEGEAFAPHLAGEPSLARRRLGLYRRAIESNLRRALRCAYPVLARLVGDGFFDEAARQFGHASPPDGADLNRYGAGFPGFLAAYGPAADLPWLADVARLEWAWHESLMAADSPGLDFAALARVPEAAQYGLRFEFRAGVRLVRSSWPVLAIWEANQPERDGQADREEGADDVLVWREEMRVRLALVEPREADFVASLLQGAGLEEAAAAVPGWDFAPALGRLAARGMLAGFSCASPGAP
jgi:Putative DNA-binding domain